jgi:hypothetical protein
MRIALAGIVLAATVFSPLDGIQPSLRVSGGIAPNGISQPLLFTWNTPLPVNGAGWAAGESVQILLHGPLDTLGVEPRRVSRVSRRLIPAGGGRSPIGGPVQSFPDVFLGTFTADAQGNLIAAPRIPYDNGVVGPQSRIPRPGSYEVRAIGSLSGAIAAAEAISLCPDTYKPTPTTTDWGVDRGGREGVFPDPLRQFSPERFDPEWPTTWSETPVELYGVIAPTGANGGDQPARISPSDNPPTHYAHDATFYVLPDPAYRWLVGTANYYEGADDISGRGTLEVEWETQNGGSTAAYGQGRIGLPLWANPTVGDRVYAVGRWILDAGHPEEGDRTELHPPRLLAAIRSRPSLSNGVAATQVDIYVSGHGGGANFMPPGLSAVLDQNRYGGGRIRDVLTPAERDRYYRPGPLATLLYPLVTALIKQVTGISVSATVYPDAGPSAFPWGAPGTEERPVNDRDYDFDVPLPAGVVRVEAVTHPEHSTGVVEQITYNGSTAHIHLPYRGADNGIYARTLKFSTLTAAPPATHLTVRLNRIDVNDSAGKWQMWADVAGQWSYLGATLSAAPIDIYLNSGQSLRIFVHGYRAACLDDYFGKLFGQTSYQAGLTFVAACGSSDNLDLGGALLDLPAASARGTYTVPSSTGHFAVAVSVE